MRGYLGPLRSNVLLKIKVYFTHFHMLDFASTVVPRGRLRHLNVLQINLQGTRPVPRRVDYVGVSSKVPALYASNGSCAFMIKGATQ